MSIFNTNPVTKFDTFLKKHALLTDKIIRMCEIYLKHGLFRHHSAAFTWLQTLTTELVNNYTKQRQLYEPFYDPNKPLDKITKSSNPPIENLAKGNDENLKQAIQAMLNVVEEHAPSKKVFSTQLPRTEKNSCSLAKTLLTMLIDKNGSRLNLEALDQRKVSEHEQRLKTYITASQTPRLPPIRMMR